MSKSEFMEGTTYSEFVYQHERAMARSTAEKATDIEQHNAAVAGLPDNARRYSISRIASIAMFQETHQHMLDSGECSPLCQIDRRMFDRMLDEELANRGWRHEVISEPPNRTKAYIPPSIS